jgi:hypothetical protein
MVAEETAQALYVWIPVMEKFSTDDAAAAFVR